MLYGKGEEEGEKGVVARLGEGKKKKGGFKGRNGSRIVSSACDKEGGKVCDGQSYACPSGSKGRKKKGRRKKRSRPPRGDLQPIFLSEEGVPFVPKHTSVGA